MSEEKVLFSWFLRAEAVNLSNFVEDTQDVSVIRGGGLILLQAARKLREKIGSLRLEVSALTEVNSGASVAICSFNATEPVALEVQSGVSKWLQTEPPYC